MKKIPTLILALALAFGATGPAVSTPSPPPLQSTHVAAAVPASVSKQITKTTTNLNLRLGPGTKYRSWGILNKGTTVAKTGRTNGKWIQIKTHGKTGWVSSTYLRTSTTKAASPAQKTAAPKSSPPRTRAELQSFVARTIAPYCPNTKVTVGNGLVSWYYFGENRITVGAGLLKFPTASIRFVAMHECAHHLQDQAAGSYTRANTLASRSFATLAKNATTIELQADAMAQLMSGTAAKTYGSYTRATPTQTQLKTAAAVIADGR
ncbi:SH3 domain-containing protein [Paeniglutamicibacter sp. NPDC091659]|uniref:SH3 domain-containing protein n=1 Tax=Paeniglutamicibacter sp. NPDC091659 TaxID=3364389 RepID=UPI0037F36408